MIDFLSIETEELNTGQQLIQSEIKRHGWKAEVPYVGCPNIFITNNDKTIHIFSTTPSTTTYATGHIANNKYATHCLLESRGVEQLPTILVKDKEKSDSRVIEFLKESEKVVVKPLDGGHGKGITVGVSNTDALNTALNVAIENAKNIRAAIVQKQYDHPEILDIRTATINYEFVGAIHRVPARVKGDGIHSVAELIEIENNSGRRGEPYRAPLAYINLAAATTYLGSDISKIPELNEEVFVLGVANYGAGGEIIDITDDIPEWMRELAVVASKSIELPVCGVDFMVCTRPTKTATIDDLQPVIVELNKCPSLAIHDKPSSGEPRNATQKYVEYLATLLS
ncbi:MAG: glutamate--cysteine ligase [Patescibacteria group bacterium]|nr:glutamate--cysteine ligase [Patescibacteria group bacterium]